MTLLWIDGFDDYANGTEFLMKWDGASSQSHFLSGGRTKGCIGLGNDFYGPNKSFPTGHATMIIGFALNKRNQGGTFSVSFWSTAFSQSQIVFLFDGSRISAQAYASGNIPAVGATTPLAQSPASSVSIDGWDSYELLVTLSPTAGVVKARKNGVEILSATGINTMPNAGATINGFMLQTYNGNPYVDDLYVANGAGSRNNAFLGDCRVRQLVPVASGANTAFVPTGAANFQNAAEVPADTATYNAGTTDGTKDTYNLTDLTEPAGTTIYGLMETIYAQKSDAGTKFVAPVVRASGTDYVRASQALSASWKMYAGPIEEVNPATGALWTVAGVNAVELGMAAKDT